MIPLANSKLRLKRARDQFDALRTEIKEWCKTDSYTTTIEKDVDTGEHVLLAEGVRDLPACWSVIAGEIVHNCRSALDNAIYDLTIRHTGDPVKGSEFPIFSTRDRFKTAGIRRIIGVNPPCRTFIESTQPFNSDEPSETILWVLHEMSNIDKHRTLPLLESVTRVSDVSLTGIEGGIALSNIRLGSPGPFKANTEIARWKTNISDIGHVDVKFDLDRAIVLDVSEPAFLRGAGLTKTLDQLGDLCESIVKDLENFH
jgi:hypothetical protein